MRWRRPWERGAPLSVEDAAAVDAERVALNLARVRTVAPIVAVIMAAAGLVTLVVPAEGVTGARWLRGVLVIDLTGAAAALAMAVVARTTAGGLAAAARRWLGEIFTITAIAVGTALAVNTALHHFRLTAWLIGVMVATILVIPRGRVMVTSHLAGLLAVSLACLAASLDVDSKTGQISAAVAFAALQLLFARILHASFVRETAARRQLATMNRELERRVAAQVGEIVAGTERIEALNRQLAGQIKTRSDELATALRRLARAEHGDGTLAQGTTVGDRFEIRHVLGVGGMGVVYEAYDRLGGQPVALKVVRGALADVNHGVRFLQEATATASLSHPAIVKVVHVDVTPDGRLYQALERVDGQSLEAALEGGRTLPAGIVARLGATLADALAAAHAHGVIHRDVKPGNIMLTAEPPGCRLLDFGLAKLRASLLEASLSEQGTVIGTPQFLAPEQVQSPGEIGGAADVYALGAVLYMASAGRLMFDLVDAMQWLFAHVHTAPEPLPASVPTDLADLILACLAKTPALRPAPADLAARLTAIADSLDTPDLGSWAASDQLDTRRLTLPEIGMPTVPTQHRN